MALNFPDSPTNGQKYTDATTGETWTYESSTNSWTSDGLTTASGIQYKGGINITVAPPAGVANGFQYTVTTGGTANAGFTGLSGTIPSGTTILYDGTAWQQAGANVHWTRSGTELLPATSGDSVFTSGAVKVGGTTAAPNLQIKGDGGIVANTDGLVYDAATKRLALGTSSVEAKLDIATGALGGGLVVGGDVNTDSGARTNATRKYFVCGSYPYTNANRKTAVFIADNDPTSNNICIGGGQASLNAATSISFYTASSNNVATGSVAMTIDSSSRVGIGASPSAKLHVNTGTNENLWVGSLGGSGAGVYLASATDSGSANAPLQIGSASDIRLAINGTEAARVDSSRRLLVGTSTTSQDARALFQGNSASNPGIVYITTATAAPSNGASLGILSFADSGHAGAATIVAARDGGTWTSGSSQPSRLVFSTTADGASSPTERMRISNNGFIDMPGVYAFTTANAANVNVDGSGGMRRSTSSKKYKTDIETLQDSYADSLLNCRPVWYRSTCEADCPEHSYWGFIAEEVAAIDPRLVHWKTVDITYDENGSVIETPCEPEPEGVAYDRFVPHLLNLIKRQGEAIAELQAEVAALKAQ